MKLPTHIKCMQSIKIDVIRGLLCCAFEGGSNYWIDRIYPNYPAHMHDNDYREGGSMQPADQYWHWCQLLPTTNGSVDVYAIGIDSNDGLQCYTLDLTRIQTGLQLLAEKHPRHFADVLTERDDATTGDVFLQLCVFGEVIYG